MGRSASCWSCSKHEEGLARRGKSCRLRWYNHLSPDIKRGNISPEEEDFVIRLHRLLGNRWTLIAGRLPGRTDNEMKNYWNTHLRKRVQPRFQKPLKKRDVPSCSEEEVVHEDICTSQNTPLKPTAVRYCGGEAAQVDIIHQEGWKEADGHDGINQEGWKEADNNVVDINTSKSWCQLLLENCMGDYQYDRLQPNNMISTSSGTEAHHQFLFPSLTRSIIFEENYSSSSCNIFDEEIPHFNDFNSLYFDSLVDLGEPSRQ